jgi:cysteine desulfurase
MVAVIGVGLHYAVAAHPLIPQMAEIAQSFNFALQGCARPEERKPAMTRPFVYLDHAATTPVDPAVLAAMLPYFTEQFGNPSSIHAAGRRAAVALQTARQTVAGLLSCRPGELVFTGSGTEGDNMALRGIALARRKATGANRILISAVEHKAVLETAEFLSAEHGFALGLLRRARDGSGGCRCA